MNWTLDAVARKRREYNDARREKKDRPLSLPYNIDGRFDRPRCYRTIDPRDWDEMERRFAEEDAGMMLPLNALQTDEVMNSGCVYEFRTALLDGKTVWRCRYWTEHEFNDYHAMGFGRTPSEALNSACEGYTAEDVQRVHFEENGTYMDKDIIAAFEADEASDRELRNPK